MRVAITHPAVVSDSDGRDFHCPVSLVALLVFITMFTSTNKVSLAEKVCFKLLVSLFLVFEILVQAALGVFVGF